MPWEGGTDGGFPRPPTPRLPASASPCPGLGRALPAAHACSAKQARQVVRRLPLDEAQRLRTFALCVARLQRLAAQQHEPLWPMELPRDVVSRILSYFDA